MPSANRQDAGRTVLLVIFCTIGEYHCVKRSWREKDEINFPAEVRRHTAFLRIVHWRANIAVVSAIFGGNICFAVRERFQPGYAPEAIAVNSKSRWLAGARKNSHTTCGSL